MPRIDRPGATSVRRPDPGSTSNSAAPTTTTGGAGAGSSTNVTAGVAVAAPAVTTDDVRNLTASPAARSARTREVMKTFFAPYDDPIKQDLSLIDEVVRAKAADPRSFKDGENPYKIHFAVYNLRHPEVVKKLGEAQQQGVDVQVLIEDHQLDPAKDFNVADEQLIAAGFQFSKTHKGLTSEQKKELDLIGIEGSGLMHLKSRFFSYPDPVTGEEISKLLTGSMNPGDAAPFNDETLHLITDPLLIERYRAKYDAVLDGKDLPNTWVDDAAVNVLFTPATKGPQAADKILELVDKEQELIFLSVFSLREVTSKKHRDGLIDKLSKAKARGVEIVIVTDKKQADGVDAHGNRLGWDDKTEDKLKALGIPVYECINESGPYNAMHMKSALFGLSDMKVVSDCGNWTTAALGSSKKKAKNDESYLFVESKKLDDNATGMRFLSGYLELLRKYQHQNPDQPNAAALTERLMQHASWPKVKVDFEVLAKTYVGQEVYITGDHPALGDWTKKGPGLKLNTDGGRYPLWRTDANLELPYGLALEYKIVKRDERTGELDWEQGDNQLLVVEPGDLRNQDRAEGGTSLEANKSFRE